MTYRLSLIFLALASPLMLLTFFLRLPFGEALFTILAAIFPVALMAIGAQRRGRLPTLLKGTFLVLSLILALCMIGLLYGRGEVLTWPWFGGLPLVTAIALYGIFLGPSLIVIYAYTSTFDGFTLEENELQRLRRDFGHRADDRDKG